MAEKSRVRISKREGALMARLAAKEQEVYEVQTLARDLYRARRPVTDFARQVYTDPAINVEFQLLTAQIAEMETCLRLKEAEVKELRATADKTDKDKGAGSSASAKGADGTSKDPSKDPSGGGNGESTAARASALVARCQRLEQENEELAASADVAKVAQLTSEKAVAEAYAGELKTALEEAYEYIEQLEEEREVHSNKLYALEEELRLVASQSPRYGQQQYQPAPQQQELQHQQHQQQQQQQQQQQRYHNPEHQQQHQQQQRRQQDYHAAPQRNAGATGSNDMQHSGPNFEGSPSWSEGDHHEHQQRRQEGREGRQGGSNGDGDDGGEAGRGRHDSKGPGPDNVPPPPPPTPAAATEAQATEDDMDDLYGDMGDVVDEGAFLHAEGGGIEGPSAGVAVKDDPMQEEEEEEQQDRRGEGENDPHPPLATRSRSTRRITRSRK